MKLLHRLIRIVVLALILWAGIGSLFLASSGKRWGEFLSCSADGRRTVAFMGVALLCLGVLYAITGLQRKRRDRFLAFTNEGGTISISTGAMADFVSKLAGEFPSIVKMTPTIVPARGMVDIVVELRVRAGPQIHEICELLQQRVRASVTEGLGISEVRRVEVSVKDIVSEHIPR